MTAAEIYESVTMGGTSDFANVVTILNRNKPWCLIGGLAGNRYVEPVYTVDIDIVVVTAKLSQIEHELNSAGFKTAQFEHPVNAQRPGSKLKVQFTTDSRYQGFPANATERDVLEIYVPVASLEDVIRGKMRAWQDKQRRSTKQKKDELDLMRIAESHPELRVLIPAEIVKQL